MSCYSDDLRVVVSEICIGVAVEYLFVFYTTYLTMPIFKIAELSSYPPTYPTIDMTLF